MGTNPKDEFPATIKEFVIDISQVFALRTSIVPLKG